MVAGVDSCSEKSGYIWGWGTASYFDLRKMWNYVEWHGILFILMRMSDMSLGVLKEYERIQYKN